MSRKLCTTRVHFDAGSTVNIRMTKHTPYYVVLVNRTCYLYISYYSVNAVVIHVHDSDRLCSRRGAIRSHLDLP